MQRRARKWLLAVALLVLGVWAAAAYVLSLPAFGGTLSGERLARAQADPRYHDGAFGNPLPPASYRAADVWAMFTGQFFGHEQRVPPAAVPVVPVDPIELKKAAAPGLRAFWIGHASVYIEIEGVRLLVDPIFSESR